MQEPFDFGRNLERRVFCRESLARALSGFRLGAKRGKALDRQHLLPEDHAELPGRLMRHGFEAGHWALRFSRSARNLMRSRLVTGRSVMPQGLMRAKSRRSVVTLKANPCDVMPRDT